MSRIGKASIILPDKVHATVQGSKVLIEGPKGKLEREIHPATTVEVKDRALIVKRLGEERQHRAHHGTMRALLNNMVAGVHQGFRKKLKIDGLGYKATQQGKNLQLSLGFSHYVICPIPEGLVITLEGDFITVDGIDKQKVGQFTATLEKLRKHDVYKNKGIHIVGKRYREKEGKTAQGK